MKHRVLPFTVLIVLAVLMSSCAVPVNKNIEARNLAMGEVERAVGEGNFQEAKQVLAVENWKDQVGKIVNLYLIDPVAGGLLVPPIQCMGVPNSSTESLEPNTGYASRLEYLWNTPVDGWDIWTSEIPGKDGTFGDPVAFRYCLGVDGNYYDFPALGIPYLVTSASFTFEPSTVKRDYEAEGRIMIAEEVLRRGGCVDPTTLVEIECVAKPNANPDPSGLDGASD